MGKGQGGAGEGPLVGGESQQARAERAEAAGAGAPALEAPGQGNRGGQGPGKGRAGMGTPCWPPTLLRFWGRGPGVREGAHPSAGSAGGGAKGKGAAGGDAALDMGQGLREGPGSEAGGILRRPRALMGAAVLAGQPACAS